MVYDEQRRFNINISKKNCPEFIVLLNEITSKGTIHFHTISFIKFTKNITVDYLETCFWTKFYVSFFIFCEMFAGSANGYKAYIPAQMPDKADGQMKLDLTGLVAKLPW